MSITPSTTDPTFLVARNLTADEHTVELSLCPGDRATAVAAVKSLRPDVDASAHKPVRGEAANGDKFTVVCTCGWVPSSAPARNSMAMASFNTHLNVVGVRRDYGPGGNQYPGNS